MAKASVEIKQERAARIAEARAIEQAVKAANRDTLNEEESAKFDSLMEDADRLRSEAADAERREKLESAEAEMRQPAARKAVPATTHTRGGKSLSREESAELLRSWALAGSPDGRPDPDTAFRAADAGFDLGRQVLSYRALSKGTTTAGGYTVPQAFSADLEKLLLYFFSIQQAVTVFPTDDGRDFLYPTVDDTSNAAGIVTEASGIGSSTDPTFGQVTYKSFDYYSPIVKVSNQVLRDSAVDIPALLAELFAERMGRAMEAAVVSTNAGSSAPEGLLYGVSVGNNLASGNAITVPKLLELEASVPIAYRNLPGTAFVMHDATWSAIRAIVDSTGRLMLNPDLQNGTEKRLLGYPVYISNAMTSIASPGDTQPLILFGNLPKYKIRRVGGSTLTRLNELYAANGQVGFVLHEAWDGRWITKNGVRTLNSYDS